MKTQSNVVLCLDNKLSTLIPGLERLGASAEPDSLKPSAPNRHNGWCSWWNHESTFVQFLSLIQQLFSLQLLLMTNIHVLRHSKRIGLKVGTIARK